MDDWLVVRRMHSPGDGFVSWMIVLLVIVFIVLIGLGQELSFIQDKGIVYWIKGY